jgi:hypothetical protein
VPPTPECVKEAPGSKCQGSARSYIADAIDTWIDDRAGAHPPKASLAVAITYAANQRQEQREFLVDPKLRLDDNASQRALRIIVFDQKNFLFVGPEAASRNLAILQTNVATCMLNDVLLYDYITDVVVRLQTHPAAKLDELLPMHWRPIAQPSGRLSG